MKRPSVEGLFYMAKASCLALWTRTGLWRSSGGGCSTGRVKHATMVSARSIGCTSVRAVAIKRFCKVLGFYLVLEQINSLDGLVVNHQLRCLDQ